MRCDTDELKRGLGRFVNDAGLLCEIKAQIRRDIVQKLAGNFHPNKPLISSSLLDRAVISIVQDFLSKKGLKRTLSVFVAETGQDDSKFLNEKELIDFFKIAQPSHSMKSSLLDLLMDLRHRDSSSLPYQRNDDLRFSDSTGPIDNVYNPFNASSKDGIYGDTYEDKLKSLQFHLSRRENSVVEKERELAEVEERLKSRSESYAAELRGAMEERAQLEDRLNEQARVADNYLRQVREQSLIIDELKKEQANVAKSQVIL